MSATSAQFTPAKAQGCANVSSNTSRSECMQRKWQTPRVDSLKFVNFAIIENEHKVRKEIFVFLCGYYICNYWGDRTDTGLCVSLWSIRLNCYLMTKLETKHILQAQACDGISTKKRTKRETSDTSLNQQNQARWYRTVLKFDSENQLKIWTYLQGWCNWTQPKKTPGWF